MCAYEIDQNDENALVFTGVEDGIADSQYAGVSDIRNVNIVSIPGEASVNFATAKDTQANIANGAVTTAAANYATYTGAANLENNMAINFTSQSALGVTANITTTYWITNLNGAGAGTFKLSSTYPLSPTLVTLTDGGSGNFTVYNFSKNAAGTTSVPVDFAYDNVDAYYFELDGVGQVWTNAVLTGTNSYWTFAGVSGTSDLVASTMGLLYYQPSNGATGTPTSYRYLFVWRNQSIDYLEISTWTWVWGWRPADGMVSKTAYLKTATIYHKAILGTDGKVYYCDGNWIGSFYQSDPTVPFAPQTFPTYTPNNNSVLPFYDTAQCLTNLSNYILIGGQKNTVYQWDTFTLIGFNYPIFLPESNVINLVTVGGNVYIFTGNRGRIYITNGSQAQFYKKIPDHLSGTVEPYYQWGGAMSNKNQLYFSALVTTNSGSGITTMGGIWAIDLDSKYGGQYAQTPAGPIRFTNQLSYGTYAGYASAMIPNFSSDPAGSGFFAGWYDGVSGYGIDGTTTSPYTGSQAYIDFDMVPIATILRPKEFKTVEYKLSVPMVSGESVSVWYRTQFGASYTLIFTSNTTGVYSDYSPVNFDNAQWIQLRAVLNSTASSPSYTRLTQLRLRSGD